MNREPPRLAVFLMNVFGPEASNEEMLGDLVERYRKDRSQVWFWRQTLGVIFDGRNGMKRAAVVIILLTGTFSLGFWAGRNPFFVAVEVPRVALGHRMVDPDRVFGTLDFLELELSKAREENLRHDTPESRKRVEIFERNLNAARGAKDRPGTKQ